MTPAREPGLLSALLGQMVLSRSKKAAIRVSPSGAGWGAGQAGFGISVLSLRWSSLTLKFDAETAVLSTGTDCSSFFHRFCGAVVPFAERNSLVP